MIVSRRFFDVMRDICGIPIPATGPVAPALSGSVSAPPVGGGEASSTKRDVALFPSDRVSWPDLVADEDRRRLGIAFC
jgi:hypothetical protein